MKNLGKNIFLALSNFLKYEYPSENDFDFIYPFTTENIDGYLSKIDVDNKDVLTVCSSGDHVLNLILKGAKKIDTFDISPLSKYYLNLKIAGVKALEYKEFLDFFRYVDYPKAFENNSKAFDFKKYLKISPYLDKYTRTFWDSLYMEFDGIELRENEFLFSRDEDKNRVLVNINAYLKEENYYKLKSILNSKEYDIKFYYNNMLELPNVLKDKYDIIMLSNIPQYLNGIYEYKSITYCLNKFRELIDKLSNKLNNNGLIVTNYYYNVKDINKNDRENEDVSYMYDFPLVNQVFEGKLEYLTFNGVKDYLFETDMRFKDHVSIYRKTKNK